MITKDEWEEIRKLVGDYLYKHSFEASQAVGNLNHYLSTLRQKYNPKR